MLQVERRRGRRTPIARKPRDPRACNRGDNTEWIERHQVGVVLRSFNEIVAGITLMLQPQRLTHFRARAAKLNNRAVFEIPDLLQTLIAAAAILSARRMPARKRTAAAPDERRGDPGRGFPAVRPVAGGSLSLAGNLAKVRLRVQGLPEAGALAAQRR